MFLEKFPLTEGDVAGLPAWTRYLRGVFDAYAEEGIEPIAIEATTVLVCFRLPSAAR